MDLRDKLSSLDVAPGKILKIVLGLAVVLLLMWLFTLSHINYDQGPDANDYIKAQADSSEIHSPQPMENKNIGTYEESSRVLTNGLITFLVLLVVLIIIWFWIDRKQSGGGKSRQRELASQVLGEGARLKIIRLNEEVWVLGVTSTSVNLLHRYPMEKWNEELNEQEANEEDMFRKLFNRQMS